jgi:hypothetical protein
MLRYTARNGTTFHFDAHPDNCVNVMSADSDGVSVPVALDDIREFLQHLDDLADQQGDVETDADCSAVGPD